MPRLKGRVEGPVFVDTTGKTWVVEKSARITSVAEGIFERSGNNNTYVIEGQIRAKEAAIAINNFTSTIDIARSGLLIGGIVAGSNKLKIDNAGEIRDTGRAMDVVVQDFALVNSGLIKGGTGIVINVADGRIVNEKSGVIEAMTTAISTNGTNGRHVDIINRGRIEADEAIRLSDDGSNRLVNRGVIEGDIFLGGGNDVFNLVGGRVEGTIAGGMGDDLLITDKRKHVLHEAADQGTDSVRSSANYVLGEHVENLTLVGARDLEAEGNDGRNIIKGNAGDNFIHAKGESDIVAGGKGNDRLFGGSGADKFVFKTGDGRDVVGDFDINDDLFDLSGWKAIESLEDLFENHMFRDGDDLVIRAGRDSLRFKDWQGEFPGPEPIGDLFEVVL